VESQEPHPGPLSSFVPVGLTSKELARTRAEILHSQPAITLPESDESRSQPLPSLVVDSLLERLRSEAPPSYTEGNVQERAE
jgi:hypothetical protein